MDRQHNGRKKRDKRTDNNLQNIHIKLKNPIKKRGWGVNAGVSEG
jgi:hypothetical protein